MTDRTLEIHGIDIPKIGLGTWELQGDEGRAAVESALAAGYRHLDTAEMYENESMVGEAIRRSGVPRDELFVTTKIWWTHLEADAVSRAVEGSLRRLGLDEVDLLLVHWPNPSVPLAETLGAFQELRDEGKTRAIGVANFTPRLLAEALEIAPELVTNQVEYHPYLGQKPLLDLVAERGLTLTAYCPLGRGEVSDDETLAEIARDHGRSPQQVALRWLVEQPGVLAIPRSSSAEHQLENIDIWGFELTDEERRRIGALAPAAGGRRLIDPAFAPDW